MGKLFVEVVEEFFNVKVVEELFCIEVVDEFSNIEVVDEFFNVKVVDEVFVFAAIRLLLRGCRAPPHSSRIKISLCTFFNLFGKFFCTYFYWLNSDDVYVQNLLEEIYMPEEFLRLLLGGVGWGFGDFVR